MILPNRQSHVAGIVGTASLVLLLGGCGASSTARNPKSADDTLQNTTSGDGSPVFTAISVESGVCCGVTSEGAVVCGAGEAWGSFVEGQWAANPHPTLVQGLESGVKAVSVGRKDTCALTSSGEVLCWGTVGMTKTPTLVNGLESGTKAVSVGGTHACAITAAGGVTCWGENRFGQLGNGTDVDTMVPTPVPTLSSGVIAISAGGKHTCALTSSGAVKCWGEANAVGDADGQPRQVSGGFMRATPTQVAGLGAGIIAVSAGHEHSCALSSSGGVVCWGGNLKEPTQVAGLESGVVAISAGHTEPHALTPAGEVRIWSLTESWPAWPHANLSGFSAISSGEWLTCGLTTTGVVVCWAPAVG